MSETSLSPMLVIQLSLATKIIMARAIFDEIRINFHPWSARSLAVQIGCIFHT